MRPCSSMRDSETRPAGHHRNGWPPGPGGRHCAEPGVAARPDGQAWRGWLALLLVAWLGPLAGCATTEFTRDDGRPVNETLLADMRRHGEAEARLRPTIERAAQLKDDECDAQWELPFALASSQGWSDDDRVAWKRALDVDERLTVIAAGARSPLKLGDRIVQVGAHDSPYAAPMIEWLTEYRDKGKPFNVKLADGRKVLLTPFSLCRGYTRMAPPNEPAVQDYHWLMSVHPLELVDVQPTADEYLWMVLWSQGVSEEGGFRMKSLHYATQVAGTMYNLFTMASGLKGAALAADAALRAAQTAATQAATDLVRQQLMRQAQALAAQRMRDGFTEAGQRLLNQQTVTAMQKAATSRGMLSGMSRLAATVFDRADAWAWQRMKTLGAQPLAAFTLHQKLIEAGLANNAFVLDIDRLTALTRLAEQDGLGAAVVTALSGQRPAQLLADLAGMPLATSSHPFAYDLGAEPAPAGAFARGLVEGLLDLPVESPRP